MLIFRVVSRHNGVLTTQTLFLLPQLLHSLCYTKFYFYSGRPEAFLIPITARLYPTVPGSKLSLEAVKVHLRPSTCMKGEKPHTLTYIYLASSPKGVLLNAALLHLFKSKINGLELPEMEHGVAWHFSVAGEATGNRYSSVPI